MRTHLDVDRLAIPGLVTPRAGDHEFILVGGVFDHQRRNVFTRADVVDRHREKLVARVSVNAGRRFVNGEKPECVFVVNPDRLWRRFEKEAIALFRVAQCFFKPFAFGDVAGEAAKTDGLIQFVLDWRNDQIQPTIFAGRRPGHKLMPKLSRFLRTRRRAGETIAFGNDAENCEERVADDLFGLSSEKLLAGEIDARQPAAEILGKDHVAGLLDEVAITRFQARAFQQARNFGDEPRGIKRNFEVVVSAGSQSRNGAFSIFLECADEQNRNGFQFGVGADLAAELETIHARHRDVADHEIGPFSFREGQTFDGRLRR